MDGGGTLQYLGIQYVNDGLNKSKDLFLKSF